MKFVRIVESLSGTRIGSADAALKRGGDRAAELKVQARVNVAFNILAVSEGLRDMALFGVGDIPGSWVPRPEWGLVLDRSFHSGVFVAREAAIDQASLSRLTARYVATRQNLEMGVERAIGKRLGYIRPQPRYVDGVVTMYLNLPDGRFNGRRVKSEFGPQSVSVTKTITGTLQKMQKDWNALAQAVHRGFEVHVELTLFSTK